MFQFGDVFELNQQYYVVIERAEKYIVTFLCKSILDGFELKVPMQKMEWTLTELETSTGARVGTIANQNLNQAMRALVFDRVNQYHSIYHKKAEFVPGKSSLQYSGKVYDEREMTSLADSMLDFWLTSGRFTKSFEKELSQFLGVRYVSLTNSGSSSNLLAVSALTSPKLGDRRLLPGDEVITVAAGFPTTITPIVQNGLVPVFVDVDLGTYNANVEAIKQAIGPKTKAIILAHTMGNPFELDEITRIAKQHHLWLIEDNCDSLGSKYNGQLTGSFGDIGTSSFYPAHHITMGEGGAIYTSNPQLKLMIESFRDWGRDCWCDTGKDNTCGKRYDWQLGDLPHGYDHKYTYSHLGYNLKATDLQAAIGLEQLNKLDGFIERRKRNFNRLKAQLKVVEDFFILPEATPNSEPSWFGFILTVRENDTNLRNAIVRRVEEAKIQTRMLFSGNIIKQPAFNGREYKVVGGLAHTDKIMNDAFLIGVYPGLNDDMIDYMAETVTNVTRQIG